MESGQIADLMRCVNFCAIKHKDQRRKDEEKTPYINHPIGTFNMITFPSIELDNMALYFINYQYKKNLK